MTVFPNTSADAAMARIEHELREYFGPKVDRLDRAAERFKEQEAGLLRPDGTPKYAPAEHEERVKGLLAEYDSVGAAVTADAEAAIAEAEREIARIDGADPIDTLKPDELARAASLAVFVDQDVDRLLPEQLAKRARAVLAGTDRAQAFVWARAIERRLAARRGGGGTPDPATLELFEVRRELAARFEDPKAKDKRRTLEQRVESARVLRGRVAQRRREVDGTWQRMLEQGRQQMRAMF